MRITAFSLMAVAIADPHGFLKPVKITGTPVALMWIQGALIPAHLYTPLLEAVQQKSSQELWIGQPSFLLDTPEPARLSANVADTLKLMRAAGFNGTTVYFGAHSLGTVFLQQYCASASNGCAAQVLTGGFIARTSYYPTFDYPVPTLTLGGSLDGLARVTRTVAESYYQQITIAGRAADFPVAVIDGMNHYQWASGSASTLEKKRDLHPELSLEQAHAAAAALIADFIDARAGRGSGAKVSAAVRATKTFVEPIVAAYLLEGSRHYNAPRQIGGPGSAECIKGGCPDHSAWAPMAQAIIAGELNGWSFSASNEYVECSSTPITGGEFHLPTITNDNQAHSVHTTTYSQGNWDLGDVEDTGFVYTSASEIGTKLSSRQCLLVIGAGVPANFSVDDPDFCKMANEHAYQYALKHADAATAARFATNGQPYTFGADIQKSGGPLFLDAGITYEDEGDAGVRISSPAQKTEKDYWKDHFGPIPRPSSVPDPGCFHYCKLLSPARAMEWIYVDGLRRHMPLQ